MTNINTTSSLSGANSVSYERFHNASSLIHQLDLFEPIDRGAVRLPSHRESTAQKLDPDWEFLFRLLRDACISLEVARQIHNALNPDRVYSATRFKIKFRKETQIRRSVS